MRTTIACAKCRRSKVKCLHDGSPPCRSCRKHGRVDCVLSGPQSLSSHTQRSTSKRVTSRPTTAPRDESNTPAEPLNRRPLSREHEPFITNTTPRLTFRSLESSRDNEAQIPPVDMEFLSKVPSSIVIKACSIFNRKFPELAFLHLPTMSIDARREPSRIDPTLLAAILALCARLLQDRSTTHSYLSQTGESYANFLRKSFYQKIMEPPSIETVQCLLIMSFYEWGDGCGYRAWMYSGMATRMMQSLYAVWHGIANSVQESTPTLSEVENEVHNRTYWSCFVMDRMISCGLTQPLALPVSEMNIHLPIGEEDFAHGKCSVPRLSLKQLERTKESVSSYATIDYSFSILIRGYEIWARLEKWIMNGGRRQSGMSDPQNCPWKPTSPWWSIAEDLKIWRQHQDERLCYPSSSVLVNAMFGKAEVFAYLNLLYYLCLLFLHREYIPFLPTSESEPRGPIDPPLLKEPAPQGWWQKGSTDLFQAAANITDILEELVATDTPLMSPFAGFCAFSAATVNLYAAAFPCISRQRNSGAVLAAQKNIIYLEKFRDLWKMGEGWCTTVQHTQELYMRATTDRATFYGKTREDFVALEKSIHEYGTIGITTPSTSTGTPSAIREDQNLRPTPPAEVTVHAETAISVNNEALSSDAPERDVDVPINLEWDHSWPLWGVQECIPFAIGGFPFNANMEYTG